jgi:tRNA wybutosine-synthesizing protein 3
MSTNFQVKKRKILKQIEVPDAEYTDLSPKGSIDAGIRVLVSEINRIDGLVTTSSCAGRISVFLEGQKKPSLQPVQQDSTKLLDDQNPVSQLAIAGPGGKGGGKWLFVSHDPIEHDSLSNTASKFHTLFGMATKTSSDSTIDPGTRFIHFKFEAMVREYPPILPLRLTNAP